ncbi:MAG: cardiolipin synthase ClsB [Ramlibacter sp.]|nr:cardiolipin synthase ClsB [Ramlibacter sp.]
MSRSALPLLDGHQAWLLEGTRALYPALIGAIGQARAEILLETYILDFTGSTQAVVEALMDAARRGVRVQLTVDGVGTGPLPDEWAQRLLDAGVQWHVYSPLGALGLLIPSRWRRLHRKLVVVDRELAFCGGINLLDDFHDPHHGVLTAPRLDYAVQVTGPLVAQAHDTMSQLWQRMEAVRQIRQRQLSGAMASLRASRRPPPPPRPPPAAAPQPVPAALLLRDNLRNRSSIEKAYRKAIGSARHEVIIANAYFLPGRKLRKALVTAARRGVSVRLLLQGRYEYFMQYYASRPVYLDLLKAGIEVHEYAPSFLHAKVAVVDGHWATVGSSNLDPLSLLLAREANVVVDDPAFAGQLRERLVQAMQQQGQRIEMDGFSHRSLRERVRERLALGLMRLALFVTGKHY